MLSSRITRLLDRHHRERDRLLAAQSTVGRDSFRTLLAKLRDRYNAFVGEAHEREGRA